MQNRVSMKIPVKIKTLPAGTKIDAYCMTHYYAHIVVVGPHKNGVEIAGDTIVVDGKGQKRFKPLEKGVCFSPEALVIPLK